MKQTLLITRHFYNNDKTISIKPGTKFNKFSSTMDMFDNKHNYIVQIKNNSILIPSDYVELIAGE
jgi:transposase